MSDKSNSIFVNNEIYKGLKRGVVYCLFHIDEVLKYKDVKKSFKNGQQKRVSPNTGAFYICKIAICKCGVKRATKRVLTDLCPACQRKANDKRRIKETPISKNVKIKAYGKKKVKNNSEAYDPERYDCWRRIFCVDKFADVCEYIPCGNCAGYEPMKFMDRFLTVDRPEVEAMRVGSL